MNAYWLVYDIPDCSKLDNPSPRLRRRAVRVNLSCWIVLEGNIPWSLINELKTGGADVHLVKFDSGEAGKLVAMAMANLRKEIRSAVARCRAAESRQAVLMNAGEVTAQEYSDATRQTVRKLRKLLADLQHAAEAFGITDGDISITATLDNIAATEASVKTKAALYAASANQVLKTRASGAKSLAKSIRDDEAPAGIVADYLDDNGGNGAPLRGLFEE